LVVAMALDREAQDPRGVAQALDQVEEAVAQAYSAAVAEHWAADYRMQAD
jgi:hypothetical protein